MISRRRALLAASSLTGARETAGQILTGEPPGRMAPVRELINASEFEAAARRKLDSFTFADIAGGDRSAFDRITFRPRLMVDSTNLDVSATLFGERLYAPILAGPISRQKRFHPDGELAMVRGASAAKAPLIVASHSSYPIDRIAAEAKTPLWFQVYLEPDMNQVRADVERAIGAGCKVLCVTLGNADDSPSAKASGVDWSALDRLHKAASVPLVLKGVMSPDEARKAIAAGVQGIVVSNYSVNPNAGMASPIELLPSIADAVAGKVPILIDGSFRRGSDVLKALALGASAVLLGRPTVWGLAAYGEEGVQSVIELIQSELARDMVMCGKPSLKALDRTAVTIHRR